MKKIGKISIGRDQAKDTGMALALILVLLGYFRHEQRYLAPAILFLIVDMVWPNLFYYPAKAWFGLAHLMGAVTSRLILTILFFGLVTPVGLMRRLVGKDPMQMKDWKKSTASVFKNRNHTYQAADVEHPY